MAPPLIPFEYVGSFQVKNVPCGRLWGITTLNGLSLQTTEFSVSVMYGDALTVTKTEKDLPGHSPKYGVSLYVAWTSIVLVMLVNAWLNEGTGVLCAAPPVTAFGIFKIGASQVKVVI